MKNALATVCTRALLARAHSSANAKTTRAKSSLVSDGSANAEHVVPKTAMLYAIALASATAIGRRAGARREKPSHAPTIGLVSSPVRLENSWELK